MKTLFVLLVGIVIGAAALYWYQNQPAVSSHAASAQADLSTSGHDAAEKAYAKSRAAATELSNSAAERVKAWHLTAPDIHAELAKTGEIVRQNTARARQSATDLRIVAVIKAKFVLDRDLSAGAIEVESHAGDVTLSGTVGSDELVGRAVADALDTDGVNHVVSKLKVGANPQ